ncbi:MAG: tetratricopeptide repeat protein, partial [Planctomycetaceae bacterium]|nr:tetratricopeptide repeat protein [Planctomycetaceae bacterium]
LLLLASAVLAGLFLREPSVPSDERLRDARRMMLRRQYDQVKPVLAGIPPEDPLYADALLILAEAAIRSDDLAGAIESYRRVLELPAGNKASTRLLLADALMHAGDLEQSVKQFRAFLQERPDDPVANSRLAFLYTATAQRWQSRPLLTRLVQLQAATLEDLVLLADMDRNINQRAFLETCQRSFPEDIYVRLGLADAAEQRGDYSAAIAELQPLVQQHPNLAGAQILLGELLAADTSGRFEKWHRELPPECDQWPGIWYARGLRAQQRNQPTMAARCYGEVLQREPNHRHATFQLGQVLRQLQHPMADAFATRAVQLLNVSNLAVDLQQNTPTAKTEASVRQLVTQLQQLGRLQEAIAWAMLAGQAMPDPAWFRSFLQEHATQLNRDMDLQLAAQNPAS